MTHVIDCGTFADLIDLSRLVGERLVFHEADVAHPVIRAIFRAGVQAIQLRSNGVMAATDVAASMNPVTADAFAHSKEVWAYCAQMGFPEPKLPEVLYGVRMEVVPVRGVPDFIALPAPDGPSPAVTPEPFVLSDGQLVLSARRTHGLFMTEFQFQVKDLFAA